MRPTKIPHPTPRPAAALAAFLLALLLLAVEAAQPARGAPPCWSAEDARAAALIWNPAARLEDRLAGAEAEALIALFNRTPPETAYRADAIEVWGLPGSAHVVLFTYWKGCFAPITPQGAPLRLPRPAWDGWKAEGGRA